MPKIDEKPLAKPSEKNKLSRKNTIHEKSAEERKESEKRQRMLARAKSLNDLNRRVVAGYSPGLNFDSSSNLSASSVSLFSVVRMASLTCTLRSIAYQILTSLPQWTC